MQFMYANQCILRQTFTYSAKLAAKLLNNVLDHISDDVRLRRTSRAGVPPLPGAPAAPPPPGEGGIPLGAPACPCQRGSLPVQ